MLQRMWGFPLWYLSSQKAEIVLFQSEASGSPCRCRTLTEVANATWMFLCVFRAAEVLHVQFFCTFKVTSYCHCIPAFFEDTFSSCAVMVSAPSMHEPCSCSFTHRNFSLFRSVFFSNVLGGIFKFRLQTLDAEREFEPRTIGFRTACWFKVSLTADRTRQGTSFITCPASAHSASQCRTDGQTFKVSCSRSLPRLLLRKAAACAGCENKILLILQIYVKL